jgi:hypothetical protein
MPLVALYTSNGDAGAFLEYPNIYSPGGEWIGFVTAARDVYSVLGRYVGHLADDRRILRARTLSQPKPQLEPPVPPAKKYPPATIPLAPLMRELTHSTVDVLLEEPERLHTLDVGEFREDLE